MMTVKRVAILQQGAFGVLLWHGIPFGVSLERTYPGQRDAQITKIKPGVYQCTRSRYNAGGYDTWLIQGGDITPERRILLHKGNTEEDSEGCILVGESYGLLSGKHAILQSGAAFQELMTLSADIDEFYLTVVNV